MTMRFNCITPRNPPADTHDGPRIAQSLSILDESISSSDNILMQGFVHSIAGIASSEGALIKGPNSTMTVVPALDKHEGSEQSEAMARSCACVLIACTRGGSCGTYNAKNDASKFSHWAPALVAFVDARRWLTSARARAIEQSLEPSTGGRVTPFDGPVPTRPGAGLRIAFDDCRHCVRTMHRQQRDSDQQRATTKQAAATKRVHRSRKGKVLLCSSRREGAGQERLPTKSPCSKSPQIHCTMRRAPSPML
eukprot:COSAG01_NODE_5299_length_4352_cov_2.254879_3_plen_251_part_00